ncbi:MAG: NEW3 domain-containing protein [Deltaproteobacteria bacterium]
MKMARRSYLVLSLVVMICFIIVSLQPAVAADEKDKRPPRAIEIYPEFPGVVVSQGEEVRMDIQVVNKGRADEDVLLEVTTVPKGWKAQTRTYNFAVTGVYVPNGESKSITFLAEPDKSVTTGDYLFTIRGSTKDGKLQSENDITVTVKPAEKVKKTKDIVITTSYPVLKGPSDSSFEFSLAVENKMDKDVVFNLSAQGPSDWDISFKPAYESTLISSLRLKAGSTSTIAVQVKPPKNTEAGEYPITVSVSSENRKAEAKLQVVLTGTYGLEIGTTSGLLSLDAKQGKTANMSIYVKNTGSAVNHNITFMSYKPENWEVKFNPETIDALEPDDLKQVEVTFTPYKEALVGDYSVGVDVKGEKATKSIEFRVTVKASTAWGWIGIGIIVVVIAGLIGLFLWLGRR